MTQEEGSSGRPATTRVAVVTGASSGIGEATVLRLAAARRADHLTALAQRAQQEGLAGTVEPATLDVRDMDSVDALAAHVADRFGRCELLVCNAGIGGGMLEDRADLDEALEVLDVNLAGTVRCCAAFAELLTASAPSQVIAVASVAGKLGLGPAAYVASKFGMVGLSEALGVAWRRRGITVTQLNPGFVRTEGFPQTWADGTPVARLVVGPEVVARAVSRAARRRTQEVTTPRWYRSFVVLRHVAAPVWRALSTRADGPRRRSEALRAQRRGGDGR